MRYFYAIEYAYGLCVNRGTRADTLHRFANRNARENWVGDGPAYHTEAGYRESVLASDPVVRRFKQSSEGERHSGPYPITA